MAQGSESASGPKNAKEKLPATRHQPKRPTEVKPHTQRISRHDKYLIEQRKIHSAAEGEIKRLDIELAENDAERAALLAEREDWARIQNDAADIINKQAQGQQGDD